MRTVGSATVVARRSFAVGALSSLLSMGLAVSAFVIVAQQAHLPNRMAAARISLSRFMQMAEVQPAPAPSVFEREMAMTPKQLLDRWNPIVQEAAQRFHIPATWLRAVMRRESGGRTMLGENLPIVSDAGAMGLMQLLPETYGEMARQFGLGSDPFNPRDNIMAAAGYLRWLHGKYGFPAMFAAYNDGPGHFEDHLHGRPLPQETRDYLKAVSAELEAAHKAVKLTRPDGRLVAVDPSRVSAVITPLPGEYAPSVHSVIRIGRVKQGVREDVAEATEKLRQRGAII